MVELHIRRLVRHIALTRDSELDCGEAFQLSASFVEAVVRGEDGGTHWEVFRVHLDQCSTCSEEISFLVRLARMDLDGSWPPTSFLLGE